MPTPPVRDPAKRARSSARAEPNPWPSGDGRAETVRTPAASHEHLAEPDALKLHTRCWTLAIRSAHVDDRSVTGTS
jgi:hypothetical protein